MGHSLGVHARKLQAVTQSVIGAQSREFNPKLKGIFACEVVSLEEVMSKL